MKKQLIAYLLFSLCLLPSLAQADRDRTLHLSVVCTTGESTEDARITLTNTDLYFDYPTPTLDAEGKYSTLIFPGNHHIKVEKAGYNLYEEDFNVTEPTVTLTIELTEAVVTPYALTTELRHNALTGQNDVMLSWNKEAPAFFDDFESHDDWSITFGEWTGIDADQLAAAPLQGDYPNRGSMQYAIIANPLTVIPAWYYDYPVLRAYSGNQYACFTTTSTGQANDDWLISPAITVGTDNILRFMAKAGDAPSERFEVYITTVTDRPTTADFTPLHTGNYESVTYEAWQRMEYSLAHYAGQTVKIAIRYISDRNRYGAFILMIDDFYVGQREYDIELPAAQARRIDTRSAANPNETFKLFLHEVQVGETPYYNYLFEDLAEGTHTLGVQAAYKAALSDKATTTVTIDNSSYHEATIKLSTNNDAPVDGMKLSLLDTKSGNELTLPVADGKAAAASLPAGTYIANLSDRLFETYEETVDIRKDTTWSVVLKERLFTPYSITADTSLNAGLFAYDALIRWNQDLGFYDSFETYDDFATQFGEWTSIDVDGMPVYPISLGGTEVRFPGSSNTGSTKALAPLVFTPSQTTPSMEPDGLVAPTHGKKEIMFLNPQSNMVNFIPTDKWLITPPQTIRENYILRFNAAGYDFKETLEIAISTTDAQPGSFSVIDKIYTDYGQANWSIFEIDLSDYAGQTVYIGLHCVSFGGWICLVDEVYIGPKDVVAAEVGKVLEYEVYLDGKLQGKTTETTYTFTDLTAGEYTVGIKAVYTSGVSEMGEYTFTVDQVPCVDALDAIDADTALIAGKEGRIEVTTKTATRLTVYNVSGLTIYDTETGKGTIALHLPAGHYIVKADGQAQKVIVR